MQFFKHTVTLASIGRNGRQTHRLPRVQLKTCRLQIAFKVVLPPDLANQPARCAKRFVLAAAALEIAAEWGIVNLAKGAGFAGVLACFEAWYERDGGGNREDRQIIKNTRDFLQAHGKSSKYFVDYVSAGVGMGYQPDFTEFWGFVGNAYGDRTSGGKLRYYLTDRAFEEHICKGFDIRKVCSVLSAEGWMLKDGKNNRYKLPKKAIDLLGVEVRRMYCLEGDIPPSEYRAEYEAERAGY